MKMNLKNIINYIDSIKSFFLKDYLDIIISKKNILKVLSK